MAEGSMLASDEDPQADPLRVVLEAGGIALAYLAAGMLGWWLFPGELPLFSPAAGVAIGGLLLFGVAYWPVLWVAASALELLRDAPWLIALLAGAGSALAAALGALLLRGAQFHHRMDRVRDVVAFAALGAAVSPALASVVTSGTLALFGGLAGATLGEVVLARWHGDATGILVVAPLLLAFASDPRREGLPRTWPVEAIMSVGLAGLLAVALFGGRIPADLAAASLLLPLPLLLWAAFRFGLAGAAGVITVFLSVCAWRTAQGVGPFAAGSLTGGSAAFWAYAMTLALVGLLLRALIAAHRNALTLLGEVFESSSDGIMVIQDGRVTHANTAAAHLFGTRGKERLVGMSVTELSSGAQSDAPDAQVAFERHARQASRGGGHRFDWSHQRLDGSTFPAEIALSPLLVDGAPGHLAVIRNVTAQKAHEESLHRAREEADSANVSKTQYLAKVSHDIRSALTSNLGFSRLMTRDESLPMRARDHAERIHRSGLNILELVNDILEMAKVEVGRLAVSKSTFELAALLQELERTFKARAAEKKLVLSVQVDPLVPRYVRADHGKLRQVLTNLLGNAVKFTPEGSVSVRVSRKPDPDRPNGSRLVFEVADSGRGIPAEDMDRIFRPLGPDERPTVATVLGLPGSLELTRVMGGTPHPGGRRPRGEPHPAHGTPHPGGLPGEGGGGRKRGDPGLRVLDAPSPPHEPSDAHHGRHRSHAAHQGDRAGAQDARDHGHRERLRGHPGRDAGRGSGRDRQAPLRRVGDPA